jgi:hypothetical protein
MKHKANIEMTDGGIKHLVKSKMPELTKFWAGNT